MEHKIKNSIQLGALLGLATAPAFASSADVGGAAFAAFAGGIFLTVVGYVVWYLISNNLQQKIVIGSNSVSSVTGGSLLINAFTGISLTNPTLSSNTVTSQTVTLTNVNLTIRNANVAFTGGSNTLNGTTTTNAIGITGVDVNILAGSVTVNASSLLTNVSVSGVNILNGGTMVLTSNSTTLNIQSISSVTFTNITGGVTLNGVKQANPIVTVNSLSVSALGSYSLVANVSPTATVTGTLPANFTLTSATTVTVTGGTGTIRDPGSVTGGSVSTTAGQATGTIPSIQFATSSLTISGATVVLNNVLLNGTLTSGITLTNASLILNNTTSATWTVAGISLSGISPDTGATAIAVVTGITIPSTAVPSQYVLVSMWGQSIVYGTNSSPISSFLVSGIPVVTATVPVTVSGTITPNSLTRSA